VIDQVQIPGYRVLRTLGVGGMATVYLAEQESLEREVALKVMAPVLAANADFCQQFLKEGRITAKLSHPNLVTIHDIGSHRGIYYMASEYLSAGSLRDRMSGPLAIADALKVARDIASGLAYAHSMGFVHRDVKPGNILFRANGTAVLADFGIAKAMTTVSSATIAGTAIGTPDYMSPEQAQATPVDGRTDLYSLGAVLYEMLTGGKPYSATDPYAVALRHVTDPVPSLPEALAWLQPMIDRMMAKDREQRFATSEAFMAECDALLRVHPEAAPAQAMRFAAKTPSTDRGRAGATKGRRRLAPAAAAAAAVFVAAVVAWRMQHPSASPGPAPGPTVVPPPPPALPVEPPADTNAAGSLGAVDTPTLLVRAGSYLQQGLASGDGRHLAFPDGDNAIDLFREALRRDPGNAVATQGLAQIAAFYEKSARSMLERGLDSTGADLVDKGLRAQPDNAGLRKLKADLAARGGQGT
jgi:hypothetical protein